MGCGERRKVRDDAEEGEGEKGNAVLVVQFDILLVEGTNKVFLFCMRA
jgi:hypothetical protein